MKYNFEGTIRTLPDLLPCPFCGCAEQPTSKRQKRLLFADFAWGRMPARTANTATWCYAANAAPKALKLTASRY